jgi:TatD DNase family protein
MEFIDTHTHLYLPEFDADREAIVETAIHRGVTRMLLPNIDSSSVEVLHALSDRFPENCYPMMGLHPTSVAENYLEELAKVEEMLEQRRYCAIGEIGIDLYWDKTHIRQQVDAFSLQLDLSLKYDLPVAIHARESFPEILEVLSSYSGKGLKGVFHAFTGTVEIAEKVIGMGFMLGIGGIVTYKKSTLPEVIEKTELSEIVLETDSPYLTPVPFRGKRNESSYIPYIAETIARIKNIPVEEVAGITSGNAMRLFELNRYA